MKSPVMCRLQLARGFLDEAEQDASLGRWRACVAHAQLAIQNALKAVIALFAPVPRTHTPGRILRVMLENGDIPEAWKEEIRSLLELAQGLDAAQVHIQTDYGDEFHGLTPWELFDEDDAREALSIARRVVAHTKALIQTVGGTDGTE